jgi:hypothetical protein
MTWHTCDTCRHNTPYDEFMPKLRMCDAIGKVSQQRHQIEFQRTYGECRDGELWEREG